MVRPWTETPSFARTTKWRCSRRSQEGEDMEIGIGLPNPVPGTPGRTLVEWPRRAEERGFSGLATIDRIAYPSYESLITLAAAAAVTERVGLVTNVLLGPTRNPVLLAKEAASVDAISGGRLTLGVGVGGREDDFSGLRAGFQDAGPPVGRRSGSYASRMA